MPDQHYFPVIDCIHSQGMDAVSNHEGNTRLVNTRLNSVAIISPSSNSICVYSTHIVGHLPLTLQLSIKPTGLSHRVHDVLGTTG